MWKTIREELLKQIIQLSFLKVLSLSLLLSSSLILFLRKVLDKVDLNEYKSGLLLTIGVLLPISIVSLAYIYLSKRRISFKGVLWDSHGNAYCPADKVMLSQSAPLNYRNTLQAESRHICPKCKSEIYLCTMDDS